MGGELGWRLRKNSGFLLPKVRGYPLPLQGYLGRKILVFNGLQGVSFCKILIVNGLRLKYLFSMN